MLLRCTFVALAFTAVIASAPATENAIAQAAVRGRSPVQPALTTLTVDAGTRLLVVAPHPDDEVLGAGGLIEHVRESNGAVRVVYLTDGEGYPAGVRAEEHHGTPTVSDYRGYGRRRQREARAALHVLGVSADSLSFLGFPNNGLSRLMTRYWSERRRAYRSPFTRFDRPPKSEIIEPDTEFRGEDLTQELAKIIADFKPTTILVTRRLDQHVDHCAAWFFVVDALYDVERVVPTFHPDLLTYIIHYYSWPFDDDEPRLPPPPDLPSGVSGWLTVPLTPHELSLKRKALHEYKSQVIVMKWFLDGFARTNEIFARPPAPRVVLPVLRSPCEQFVEADLPR